MLAISGDTGNGVFTSTAEPFVVQTMMRAGRAPAGRPRRSSTTLLARCIEQGLIRAEEIEDYRPGQGPA